MISFGLLVDVPLDTARNRAAAARDLLCQGVDPSAHRQTESAAQKVTFESVGRQWLSARESLFRKGIITPSTFRKQRQILEQHLFPTLGARPLKLITSAELLVCLKAIEAKGLQETAHRARRACWRIFNLAEIHGQVDHNPADALRVTLEALRPFHHAGITEPRRLGELLRSLRGYTGNRHVWYALQLLPLLFVRPCELRLAEWTEFDLDNAVWRIPAHRMKMRRQHLVPLCSQVLDLLKGLRTLSPRSPHLFPASSGTHPAICAQSFATALLKLGYSSYEQTPHGFRTTASTLLRELGWNADHVERQLAHVDTDKIRRIYNHAEYLDSRTVMMQAWGDYLDRLRIRNFRGNNQWSHPCARADATAPLSDRHRRVMDYISPATRTIRDGSAPMILTERAVRLALPHSSPHKLSDGRGLYLHVGISGGKHWHYRYRFHGRDTTMSLGTYPHVSLEEARRCRFAAKQAIDVGLDPQTQKRPTAKRSATLRQVGRQWLAQLLHRVRALRRSIKTFRKAKALLTRWVFPALGDRPIDAIQPQDVSSLALHVQALGLHETAHRVVSHCGRVLRHGVVRGLLKGDVTRDLRSVLESNSVLHHAAITAPAGVGRLLRDIDRYHGHETTVIALQLSPLLFVRPGELRKARWEEIDEQAAQWRIPAQRMKGRVVHVVPLSAQAVAHLGRLRQLTGHTEFLFPTQINLKRCMSDNTLNKALR